MGLRPCGDGEGERAGSRMQHVKMVSWRKYASKALSPTYTTTLVPCVLAYAFSASRSLTGLSRRRWGVEGDKGGPTPNPIDALFAVTPRSRDRSVALRAEHIAITCQTTVHEIDPASYMRYQHTQTQIPLAGYRRENLQTEMGRKKLSTVAEATMGSSHEVTV